MTDIPNAPTGSPPGTPFTDPSAPLPTDPEVADTPEKDDLEEARLAALESELPDDPGAH
jgi:hypothetical protein